MNANVIGSLVLAVPAIVIAWLALRRQRRAPFWFALALILVALGYLNATGATRDVAVRLGLAPAAVQAK